MCITRGITAPGLYEPRAGSLGLSFDTSQWRVVVARVPLAAPRAGVVTIERVELPLVAPSSIESRVCLQLRSPRCALMAPRSQRR